MTEIFVHSKEISVIVFEYVCMCVCVSVCVCKGVGEVTQLEVYVSLRIVP